MHKSEKSKTNFLQFFLSLRYISIGMDVESNCCVLKSQGIILLCVVMLTTEYRVRFTYFILILRDCFSKTQFYFILR